MSTVKIKNGDTEYPVSMTSLIINLYTGNAVKLWIGPEEAYLQLQSVDPDTVYLVQLQNVN